MLTHHQISSLEELEQKAKDILNPQIYDFIAGGAGKETGMHNNRLALQNYHIIPRVLQDVSDVNTSVDILGETIATPIIIGPCAFHKLVCEEGEIATAKATAAAKTIMTLSTMSSLSIEEVSDASSSSKWFQLYVFKDREITKNLVRRAENSGYTALVVTVDVPVMGMRLRDIRNKFSLPETVEAANFREAG